MIELYAANYIIMWDNLNNHKLEDTKVEAKRLVIGLVFLPYYFPTRTR